MAILEIRSQKTCRSNPDSSQNDVRLIKSRELIGEGRDHPKKTRFRREDNIRIDRREIGWEFVYWTHLAQKRDRSLSNTIM
jgi:hypothetical protein